MMRWLVVLLAVMAAPANATTDAWPSLQDVINVEPGDVLNVRAGPGTDFDVIGTLPHDAENIEVIRPDEDFEWGLLNIGEVSGWASLGYLAPHPGQWFGQFPNIRLCYGTEPFWSIRIDDDAIAYSSPESNATGHMTKRWTSTNMRDSHAFSFRLGAETGGTDIVAVLSERACGDGMSDRDFGIHIDLLFRDGANRGLVSGCCSIQPPAE